MSASSDSAVEPNFSGHGARRTAAHESPAQDGNSAVRLRVEKRWVPPRKWESFHTSARDRAAKRKAALSFYYSALGKGVTKENAKRLAMQAWQDLFGERCTEKTVRNWVDRIEGRGGFQFAPMEAYIDGLSCAHKKAQLQTRLPARLVRIASGKQLTSRKRARRKIADLRNNLCDMEFPHDWLVATVKVLCAIQQPTIRNYPGRAKIQSPERWRPAKMLAEYPPSSQAYAWGRRLVIQAYHEARKLGCTREQAKKIARAMSFLIFDKAPCEKTIRNLLSAVEARGGIADAPIEAFAMGLSIPHMGAHGRARNPE